MIRGLESIVFFTGNADALASFYKDKVGLEIREESEGEDGSKMFELKAGDGPGIYLVTNSEIKGKNQGGAGVVPNLEVDDIEKEDKRMKDAGVNAVEEVHHLEGYGLVATYEDPDGNKFCFAQVKAAE